MTEQERLAKIQKYYKYMYTGFVINTHDDSTMRWAGSDF